MRFLVTLLCFSILLAACDDDSREVSINSGYDFFPYDLGQYRIYEVEEVVFDAFGGDTSQYWLKEVVSDTIISDQRDTTYLLSRFKADADSVYHLDSIWTARRSDLLAIVTENNVPYAKLAFPVSVGKNWNGNSLNTQSPVTYYYEEASDIIVGDTTLPAADVIRVIIEDIPENLVNQDERSEVYARGIGLVEKDYITLNFCSVNCNELGEIQSGRILKQSLVTYGSN